MSFKKTVILAIIFILVAGFLFQLKWRESKRKVERIFTFNPREVEEIRLVKGHQTITLKKEEKEWKGWTSTKTGSTKTIGDEKIIYNLLSVFDYGILEVIDDHPTTLADFGLDSPEFEFSIKTKGDSAFKTLLIGSDNPAQNSCYAKVETLPRVLLLGILYKTDLDSIFDRLHVNANGKSKAGKP
jgi:Domain of unknown function (DUF4340)